MNARVSIVMPMYNAMPYLKEAIDSVLHQTFVDWELLVVDDSSTDDGVELVKQYEARDHRIKLLRNNTGTRGAGMTRNVGIDNAVGEYIMIMDSDDISVPRRVEIQVNFMDSHPDMAMSGAWGKSFGGSKKIFTPPTYYWLIKALILFRREFYHNTIIFRREQITHRYPTLTRCQDVAFGIKTALMYRVANVPKILYLYRVHGNSITHRENAVPYLRAIYTEFLPVRLGFQPTPEQIEAHLAWTLNSKNVSMQKKMQWLLYVIIRGNYAWYERAILAVWCGIRTCFIGFYRAW